MKETLTYMYETRTFIKFFTYLTETFFDIMITLHV